VEVLLRSEERLDAVDGLAERRADLVNDPRERRRVWGDVHQLVGILSFGHDGLSKNQLTYAAAGAAAVIRVPSIRGGESAAVIQARYVTRNRAIEAFNSRASVASWPIDCAAWRVPCDVWSVTARMRSIETATPPADSACSPVVPAMRSISSASWRETRPM